MKRYTALPLYSLFLLVILSFTALPMLAEPAERPDPGAAPGWDYEPMWGIWHPGMGAMGAFAMALMVIIVLALVISLVRALTYHKH